MADRLAKTQDEQTKLTGFPAIAEDPMVPVRTLRADSPVSVPIVTALT